MTNKAVWLGSLLLAAVNGAALAAWAVGSLRVRVAIEHEVPVELTRALSVKAEIARPLAVSVDEALTTTVKVTDLTVPLDETLGTPSSSKTSQPRSSWTAKSLLDSKASWSRMLSPLSRSGRAWATC